MDAIKTPGCCSLRFVPSSAYYFTPVSPAACRASFRNNCAPRSAASRFTYLPIDETLTWRGQDGLFAEAELLDVVSCVTWEAQ
jgi:hypothetical protein